MDQIRVHAEGPLPVAEQRQMRPAVLLALMRGQHCADATEEEQQRALRIAEIRGFPGINVAQACES